MDPSSVQFGWKEKVLKMFKRRYEGYEMGCWNSHLEAGRKGRHVGSSYRRGFALGGLILGQRRMDCSGVTGSIPRISITLNRNEPGTLKLTSLISMRTGSLNSSTSSPKLSLNVPLPVNVNPFKRTTIPLTSTLVLPTPWRE